MSDSGGNILATLFAGTSPGFGKVHARLLGEEDVFSVKLSNYEIASGVDDWLDKRLLAVDRDPVKIRIKRLGGQADLLDRGDEFLWTWNERKQTQRKFQTISLGFRIYEFWVLLSLNQRVLPPKLRLNWGSRRRLLP